MFKDNIVSWIKKYFVDNGPDCNAIIGISGGKDSSVCAALLCEALGPDRVIAVKMPQGKQTDIADANELIDFLGIKTSYEINIGPACDATYRSLPPGMSHLPQVYTNVPARERMKVLYAIVAAKHGRVCNTCNRSEDYIGYSTKFGDSAGDFAPIASLTVREVKQLGRELGLPEHLINKIPADGLCRKTDEDNLGFTYDMLDDYLLEGIEPPYEIYKNIEERHKRNLHKTRIMPSCPKNIAEDGYSYYNKEAIYF